MRLYDNVTALCSRIASESPNNYLYRRYEQ